MGPETKDINFNTEILRSKITLRVKKFEKIVGEDGEIQLKNIDNIYDTIKRKDFLSIAKVFDTEVVNEEPSKFKFNTLYIRLDGKAAWLYGLTN